MLFEFIDFNRNEIIRRCREKVARRSSPPPTPAEIDHGVPLFLSQLIHSLRSGVSASAEISDTALLHGQELLRQGFSVSQVVHDYGDVCQSITELAVETNAPISAEDFRVLNGCLDNAIAGAVTEFGRGQIMPPLREDASPAIEASGFFAHELRNLLNTALIAFQVVKTGNVGVAGSTGAVLHRSLVSACDLVARSLAGIRLTQGVQHPERLLVAQFVAELTEGAVLAANAQGVTLTIPPVEEGVTIDADRQVLSAVLTNVLQNAFKFTRPRSTVILRVRASAERVLFEIQDECGGLPGGNVSDLFRPFEQRGLNRTGLGLGLAFSRLAIEVNRGRLYAADLPGIGCVFTVDLPRCPAAVVVSGSSTPVA
jgi:signal transduction histidine kinase